MIILLLKKTFRNQSGQLILNLLVSIGIFLILSLVSIPYIKKYQPNLKLSASGRDLVVDLRYAQQLSVTEQVVHAVKFDLDENSYDILKLDTATSTVKTVVFDPEISFEQVLDLPDNMVVFNFYGGVSDSGQVYLVNNNNKSIMINIKPSGYVQIEE